MVEDARKRSVLFTSLGSKGYHTLRALLLPSKPADKSYQDCVDLLKNHYAPKPSEIVLRYRFYTRSQKSGETVPQFIAGLRQLSENCNFAELNNMLRDRLVVGCREPTIQQKLLGDTSLTFEKALNIATAMEMASKDVEKTKEIGHPDSQATPQVNRMHPPKQRPKQKSAESGHKPASYSHNTTPRPYSASQGHAAKPKPQSASQGLTQQKCWRCGGHMPL